MYSKNQKSHQIPRRFSIKILVAFLVAVILLGSRAAPGWAQDSLEVQGEDVQVAFGESLEFTARLILPNTEGKTMLFIRPREGFHTSSVEVSPGITGRISHSYALGGLFLPPFSDIQYWYQWEGSEGETLISPTYSFEYFDNRYSWRTIESAPLRLHWNEGDLEFAQEALDVARESFMSINNELDFENGQATSEWIDIYIYRSAADLQSALSTGDENWLAGHADPQLGVVLVSIPPGPDQTLEMERQIPHEIGHVMLYRKTGPEYSDLPVWLNEGFASLNELYPNPNYPFLLDNAYQDELLFQFERLCGTFPASASDILLAYAQSASFTTYLHNEYGRSGVNALIDEYSDGKSCERGAEIALGKSLSVLERDWRQEIFGEDAWRGLVPWLGLFVLIFIPMLISIIFMRRPTG